MPCSRPFLNVCLHALVLGLMAAAPGAQAAPPTHPPAVAAVQGLPNFSPLVQRVGPSVVHIRVTRQAAAVAVAGGPEVDEETREFLRRHLLPRGADPERAERVPDGVGSGFVLSAEGVLLTNAHVVERAAEVRVRLPDGREFPAQVLGADKRSDVAVLKIEAQGLAPVRFGDPARLAVGEWVIAIGSPFGLDNSVTAGIVSAKARDTGELLPLIQTDVAINPGNSGGPLINLRGEVVGINSQIYSRSGGYQGIAFAIPSDEVQRIARQLREHGRVQRSRIGIRIGEVSPELARSLGLAQAEGALVQANEPGGPGERAGLEAGDVITHFDGQPVRRSSDLPRLVVNTRPGSAHEVQLFRQGRSRSLTLQVAEIAPETREARAAAAPAEATASAPAALPTQASELGLTLEVLPSSLAASQRLRYGLKVVTASGLAARAGLREGDIVLRLGDTNLRSPDQLDETLARQPAGQPLRLLVQREGVAQYLFVRGGT